MRKSSLLPLGLMALLLSSAPALADVADGGSDDGGTADGGGSDDDGGDDDEDDDDGCGNDDGATTGASLGLGAFLLFGLRRRRQ